MTGELIYKSRQQFGAIVWNLEYDETNKIIYTVGSTGNVLPFYLPDIIDNEDNPDGIRERNVAVLLPQPTNNYMKIDNIPLEHYVAKLKLLNPSCLVALTNKNQFICYRNQNIWDLIDDFTNTKCTVLEVKQNKVAVCGYKRLTLYKYKEITSGVIEKYYDCDNIVDGLIRAFIFLTPTKYIICDDRGNCLLLQESVDGPKKEQSISLPKCKEPWLTCAILVQMDFLVVANRQGNMFLYRRNTEEEKLNLVFTLKHPHGHLGATLIKLVADSAETALLQSAGHDSTIKYIKLCKSETTLKITKRENVPVCWVKALEPMEELRAELLLGFNDNHFVIWSRLYDFHLQLSCGGGHRYWDYFIYEKLPAKSPRIKIVFIKNKQVLLYDRKLLSNTVINPVLKLPRRNMWHTKPCNILKCLESAHRENTSVIISGGDDNVIKISIYNNVEGVSHEALRQINEVHSHISNIRAMVVLRVKGDDYLIFTGGGRAQMCVTKLNTNTLEFEEMLNISLKTLSDDSTKGSNYKYFAIDPEVRIMSLDVSPSMIEGEEDKGYIVFIGCSDGFVRKYKINEYWQISLLGYIHYGKCILQVRLVGHKFLLVAATDGLINYCSLDLTHFDKLIQHHLSGVNAMDIHYSHQKQELQVLTGGDDQAVVFSKLSISSSCTLPTVLETVKFETLHTAQVTAVQLSSCGYYAFSGSVDQNLLMTDLRIGKVIKKFHTCVADIKGLCVDSCDKACILYGCGMQIYSFK